MTRLNLNRLCLSGLAAGLLVITGCEGSTLGDAIGKSLAPDPQLVDGADEGADVPQANAADKPTQSTSATNNKKPTKEPQPTEKDDADKPETVETAAKPEEPKVVAGEYTDLAKAPEELQPYLIDLLELDLLEIRPPATPAPSTASDDTDKPKEAAKQPAPPAPDEFRPNQAITRREYARWLLDTNNRFYASQRNLKIRAGLTSSTPVFQDVKAKDPDFAAIQGLAEAGMIPSPLTGSSTSLTFRPDAPLTRKDMLLWKVPLDTRQPLPQATPTAVKEAWGFQDAGKIEARALQAVLADFQNGDLANIRRAFNYTTLFQPDKAATRAEAASVVWRYGNSTEGITAQDLRNPGAADDSAEEN